MKKIAFAAAMLSAVVAAAGAPAAGTALYPHAYSTRITGATPSLLNGTWRLAIQKTAFAVTKTAPLRSQAPSRSPETRSPSMTSGRSPAAAPRSTHVHVEAPGATLTLTRVNDSCVGRRTVFTHSFTRIGAPVPNRTTSRDGSRSSPAARAGSAPRRGARLRAGGAEVAVFDRGR